MRTFEYERAATIDAALARLPQPDTQLIAGGTELLNWIKEGIEAPQLVLDITGLPLTGIEAGDSGLRVGALETMSDVQADRAIQREYPVIAQALVKSASAQLRNMATIGGNLLQRTRCPYFRADVSLPCNKREPGSGCAALDGGDTSRHAIFGGSRHCVATHPSDLAVALAALDASVVARSARGERRIPLTGFHRLPGEQPDRHTELLADELIVAVEVPAEVAARRSHYVKVRERTSYEFAVVSAAAVVELDGHTITRARVAIGGVAPRPWRLRNTEVELPGIDVGDTEGLRAAVAESFGEASPLPGNEFKVELAQRATVRAVQDAGATT
ncbi:FAD binding domain-containing protein [Amycolatopsis anabasis]|uniref:FAD binding domain-containing protein n=1 Tax=Amycolatopsis anabasis TaxID=1840409 RepID=UPI00131DFB7B|nr:FAD binding domain-containing protein [Amycolatopsis anabasis]